MEEPVTRYNTADVEAMIREYKRLLEENRQLKEEIQRLKWAATAHDWKTVKLSVQYA